MAVSSKNPISIGEREQEERVTVGEKRKRSSGLRVTTIKPVNQVVTRSPVWLHFTKLHDNNQKASCNYCGKVLGCASTNGTTNMKKHYSKCKKYLDFVATKAQKVIVGIEDENEADAKHITSWVFNQDVCRRATVKMIILDELPFSFVENVGFRQFCKASCPMYVIPSRRTITRDVLDLYMTEKASLKSLLSENNVRISLTTDIWTSITTVSYMVITAHFIDTNWQLQRKIIGFKPISNHKGETIARQLENCLNDWGIEKLCTTTVDNASANDSAIRILKSRLKTKSDDALILDGEFMHVRCCAHVLNLIVNDGLLDVDNSVISIRNAVKYVRASHSRLQAFQRRADQANIKRGSLVLDCNTRWNSTFLMLSAALKFRVAFERMAEEDKLYDAYFHEDEGTFGKRRVGPPSSNDWENGFRMVKFLKIFYDSTLSFSASTKVTSTSCYNEICKIESTLAKVAANSDLSLSSLANNMRAKFNKYWEGLEKINKLLIVAAVLDPRGKMNFVNHCFETLYGKNSSKSEEMKNGIMDVLQRLFAVYNARYHKPSCERAFCESGIRDECESKRNQTSGCDVTSLVDLGIEECVDPFSMFSEMIVGEGNVGKSSNELDLYLMEDVEKPNQNRLDLTFDILLWWKVHSPKYPVLAEIARDFLAIPVSTVASESAFSTSGRVLDQYRSSLNPEMVEALILSQDWLRSSLRSIATMKLHQVLEENAFMDALAEDMRKQTDVL